jgi:hypothetical protein
MSQVHELYHQAVIARGPTIQVLASLRLFEGIDSVDLTDMTVTMRTRRHRAGEVIFHQGEPGGALHVIGGGMVKLVLRRPAATRPSWPRCAGKRSSANLPSSIGDLNRRRL